ncbi:MAG: hypothetical protein IKN47_07560 [Lachnospiraceae bacterium]|nr:hypothetical protein [Lachnospiraceae bacterium]
MKDEKYNELLNRCGFDIDEICDDIEEYGSTDVLERILYATDLEGYEAEDLLSQIIFEYELDDADDFDEDMDEEIEDSYDMGR